MAPITSRTGVTWRFNDLQHGLTYLATTRTGFASGEYLGMETRYGDWAILLRNGGSTTSVSLVDVTSIQAA